MFPSLKATVKAITPGAVLHAWRRVRFGVEQFRERGRTLDEVFYNVYDQGKWGAASGASPFFSGVGSLPQATAAYETFVAAYFEKHPEAKTLVDIGCGDFQVGSRILARISRPVGYIGCDIAANVVAYNAKNLARDGIEFRVLDITREEPPAGDVIVIREVLQHLSNAHIEKALANLRRRYATAIITESVFVEPSAPNLDIVSGRWTRDRQRSGVYVDLPPFSLPVLDECCVHYPTGEMHRTTLVALNAKPATGVSDDQVVAS
jgi:SAM-dependent methyltransferase